MTLEEIEKRLISLEKKERATNKLLNFTVNLIHRHRDGSPLSGNEIGHLEEEVRAFHKAHGIDVDAVDEWIEKGGPMTTLDKFYKEAS